MPHIVNKPSGFDEENDTISQVEGALHVLFAQLLCHLASQVHGTNRVSKAGVGGPGEDVGASTELVEVAETLKVRRVNDGHEHKFNLNEAMDGVVDGLGGEESEGIGVGDPILRDNLLLGDLRAVHAEVAGCGSSKGGELVWG